MLVASLSGTELILPGPGSQISSSELRPLDCYRIKFVVCCSVSKEAPTQLKTETMRGGLTEIIEFVVITYTTTTALTTQATDLHTCSVLSLPQSSLRSSTKVKKQKTS